MRRLSGVLACALAVACGQEGDATAPSDDPADWAVDTSVSYVARASEPRWMVPSVRLPEEVGRDPANNNVDIQFYEDRLFMAWRAAETHFASPDVEMHVVSSLDRGQTWDYETTIALGTDVREPRFLAYRGRLHLYFFEAGDSAVAFEPKHMWRIERTGLGEWTEKVNAGRDGEIPWDLKVRDGAAYMTSYAGNHYTAGEAEVSVFLQRSEDGVTWAPVDPDTVASYVGGVSEVAFELDAEGGAWFVGRNEDGDETGFGSLLCRAEPGALAAWDCPSTADPERYDSPEMFRHGDELYLVARRDIGGPYDQGKPGSVQENRTEYLVDYSTRPKTTALYRIDTQARRVVHVMDLPGAGDTAFPSIRRTGAHTFLLANYTSPLDDPDISWLDGQVSDRGTRIYFLELSFEPAQ